MAETLTLTVTEGSERLDRFLVSHSTLSRSRIQQLIGEGRVTVNGQPAKAGLRLAPGDVVHAELSPAPALCATPQALPLNVVYEDDDLLVINKPPGLTVHPAPGHPDRTLVNALLAYRPELASLADTLRPGIVHRLDRDTSGLMVVAKHPAAQEHVARQLQERQVSKKYLALVEGTLTSPRGLIDAPIGRDPSHRQRMAVVAGGREAYTRYRVLQHFPEYTLLEAEPVTGRTHQIRVHLAAIGHPIVGDTLYGRPTPLVPRQFLHAHGLGFRLPSSNQRVEFSAALPPDLRAALDRLALAAPADPPALASP
ncbi:MAG: RluA family pseudouridine synthase [Chloroflexi bacterium]|nr:RluA family pseudouridine synthase [Chloroflexota bacterium]